MACYKAPGQCTQRPLDPAAKWQSDARGLRLRSLSVGAHCLVSGRRWVGYINIYRRWMEHFPSPGLPSRANAQNPAQISMMSLSPAGTLLHVDFELVCGDPKCLLLARVINFIGSAKGSWPSRYMRLLLASSRSNAQRMKCKLEMYGYS